MLIAMKMNEIKVRAAIAALPECISKVEHPIGIVDMGEYDRLVSEMTNHAASMAVRYADALVMALQNDVESVKTKKVYLCVLLHDDGCFKAIVGCFATREDAEAYSCYRKDIVIQELKVGYYGKDNL